MTEEEILDNKTWGIYLKEMRIMRNVSVKDLSKHLGVSASYLYKCESGKTRINLSFVDMIISSLGYFSLERFGNWGGASMQNLKPVYLIL